MKYIEPLDADHFACSTIILARHPVLLRQPRGKLDILGPCKQVSQKGQQPTGQSQACSNPKHWHSTLQNPWPSKL